MSPQDHKLGAPHIIGIALGALFVLSLGAVGLAFLNDTRNGTVTFSDVNQRSCGCYSNCDANLKQVGLALLMYAGEHDGNFPSTPIGHNFEPLNQEGILPDTGPYCCERNPATHSVPAAQSDFVYAGSGLTDDMESAPTTPLAFCPVKAGHSLGRQPRLWGLWTIEKWRYDHPVLFVDGHVEWLADDDPRYRKLLRSLVEEDMILESPRQQSGFPPEPKTE